MDECLRDVGLISVACRGDVCDERCCGALKARLHGQCSRAWAHHHALYVSRVRNDIRNKCGRDCAPRLACFFMDDESPCQARECRELFSSGRMSPQCHASVLTHCANAEDSPSTQTACAAFNATMSICDETRPDWLDCAIQKHVGPDWMQDVSLLKSPRISNLRMAKETMQYISAFGCTHTPIPGLRAPCPKGFVVVDAEGHTAYRKSAFTTASIGSGYRDSSAENIATAVLVPVFCLLFLLLSRLKLG